ncbi:hypothetical protein Ddye_017251 [Dipteronia dyeriana]|uniref:BED-type domain-containing protein n=1 Tax=Dipteronia dyeriana TaxID=168575 RepID=A0AAD9U8D2_9ROSI|nr:hypothetical protein Ddye_017251 [Dipteronia dyeriana]
MCGVETLVLVPLYSIALVARIASSDLRFFNSSNLLFFRLQKMNDDIDNVVAVNSESTEKPHIQEKLKTVGGNGRSRSDAWNHFTRYLDGGRMRAQCNYCSANYASDSNTNRTTNMNKHIDYQCKNYHAKLAAANPKQKCLVKQASITSYTTSSKEGCGSSLGLGIFNKEDTRNALAEMLIVDELPFRFVEKRGFGKFCRVVNDGLKEMHESVCAISNAVKFVKSSPSIFEKFKKSVESEKIQNKGLVVLDVPTRWNSTYLMLASSLKFVKAFDRLDDEDLHYQTYFNMKIKFEKYWGSLEKTNKLLIVAVVLDPRYKLQYVSYCFSVFYGVANRESMTSNIKNVLVELYECYSALFSGGGGGGGVAAEIPTFCDLESDDSSVFDLSISFLETVENQENLINEVERYLLEPVERKRSNFDVLTWWSVSSAHYPNLALIAKDVFAMPISTVASESAFSSGGRALDPFRSSLTPKMDGDDDDDEKVDTVVKLLTHTTGCYFESHPMAEE